MPIIEEEFLSYRVRSDVKFTGPNDPYLGENSLGGCTVSVPVNPNMENFPIDGGGRVTVSGKVLEALKNGTIDASEVVYGLIASRPFIFHSSELEKA